MNALIFAVAAIYGIVILTELCILVFICGYWLAEDRAFVEGWNKAKAFYEANQ